MVIVLLVLRTIWAFNEFDMVYLPAGGGPLFETTTIPVYIRRIAFEFNDIGHAAGVAMVDAGDGGVAHQRLFLGLPARGEAPGITVSARDDIG